MGLRRLCAAVLALPLVLAGPGGAAPQRPRCGGSLTDDRGDAGPLAHRNLDIIGADISEGRTEIYAVLWLAGAENWVGERVAGSTWRVSGTRNGVPVEFTLQRRPLGAPSYPTTTVGGRYVATAGVVAGDLVLWKATLPRPLSPRPVWRDIRATTGTGPLEADTATGKGRRC